MTKEQLAEVTDAIANRTKWEQRQSIFYDARHQGQGRKKKPYLGAPDLHFPLCDSLIQRTKPFYVQQLYLSENIASFRPLFEQQSEQTEQLQAWYDYQLKQHSNFEEEIFAAIDGMLVSGRGVVGVSWDAERKYVCFNQINPLYFVVPDQVDDIQKDASWVLHVEVITEAQYKNCPRLDDGTPIYNQDEDFIKRISGAGENSNTQRQYFQDKKAWREGLTWTTEGKIIVWNFYTKDKDGVRLETLSPCIPVEEKTNIRNEFGLPYNKGCFKKGTYPFFSIRYEIKDKGWYSPRGIIEQALPFENSISALWNGLHEYMDFACKPIFVMAPGMGNIGNSSNLKPGDCVPNGTSLLQQPAPPVSFEEQMNMTRATAEYLIQIPDVGANQHLSGRPGYAGEKPTATQIQAIVGMSNQSNDLHGRLFKMDASRGLDMAWALFLQYKKDDLNYFVQNTRQTLPQSTLVDDYTIELNVSADNWNKEAQVQKAMALLQTFQGNPYVGLDAATKKALNWMQPGLARDLYRDPGTQQQSEQERQNEEIVMMLNNFSVSVKPFDDDKAHLNALDQFGQVRMQEVQQGKEQPPTPMQAQAFIQHTQGHLQALQQKKDPMAKQATKQMEPFLQILAMIAQQDVSGANGVAQPPPQPMANGQAGGAPDQDKPSAVANALANLIKSGVKVSTEEINAALVKMGLPPAAIDVAPTTQELNATKAVADAVSPPVAKGQAGAPVAPGAPGAKPTGKAGKPAPAQAAPAAPPFDISKLKLPAPIVNVSPPLVNVPAPVVHVEAPKAPTAKRVKVIRDKQGNITGAEVEHG